jgi:thiol-disulfide isomerase/thioredoxin
MPRLLTPAAFILAVAVPVLAQAPTLTVGDAAPALKVEKWLKGSPVPSFKKGQVYVVEFWATWCGPCRASIPHLTELKAKHKDKKFNVIGVNVWEHYKEDTLDKVKAFVADQGPKMDYTVAYDGPTHAMADAYMKAAKQPGIPTAFIVDRQGRIVYIGHPLAMDAIVDQVLAGTWTVDMGKAELTRATEEMKKMEEQAKALAPLNQVMGLLRKKEYDQAYALGHEILAGKLKDMPEAMNALAWMIVDPKAKPAKQDLDLALQAATRACELTSFKDSGPLDTLARVQFSQGDTAKAVETEKKAIALSPAEGKADMEAALKEFEAAQK